MNYITLTVVFLSFSVAKTQQTISDSLKTVFIDHLNQLIEANYVFPKVATSITANLSEKNDAGYFKQFQTMETFAEAVTDQLRSVNGDLHLKVATLTAAESDESISGFINECIADYVNPRLEFAGFNSVRNLGDGVGYLNLSLFRNQAFSIVDSYMKILQYSDALIIDLRDNRGGTTEMVNYLLSYFFEGSIHSSNTVNKKGEIKEVWTRPNVNGTKLSKEPLFILINGKTASGAEGFSFAMKNKKRAKLIGEKTIGAAHSGGRWYIDGFSIFVPNERHVDPVSETDWEGKGVIPDIMVASEAALDTALILAKDASSQFRNNYTNKYQTVFKQITELLDRVQKEQRIDARELIRLVTQLMEWEILSENAINAMGYTYMENNETKAAEILFKVNTILFPNSANVYDSYADALEQNGKLAASLDSYKKALDTAIRNKNTNLEGYKQRIKRVSDKIGNAKND
ncbi:MAG: S41 family peptidase [Calditrichaeota bacterium]|nr:S41 family peptidase [Calditrichota bacterium]